MDPKAENPPRKQHHNGPQRENPPQENPPQPDQPQRRQPDDELRDLSRLTAILAKMQPDARGRAVRYLIDRFGPRLPVLLKDGVSKEEIEEAFSGRR